MKLLKKIGFKISLFLCITACWLMQSCNKAKFLEAKPSTSLVVPTSLSDFRTLLDNYDVMNTTPVLGEMASDDYYFDATTWQAQSALVRNSYIWAQDIFEGQSNTDWKTSYNCVFYANVILEGLGKLDMAHTDLDQFNQIKAEALTCRANAFFNLVSTFALPLDSNGFATDLGIPLKLSADVNNIEQRATIKTTFDQILQDINEAVTLFPNNLPTALINRHSKASAYALLSRIYLSIRNYPKASEFADKALALYNTLIDYNTVSLTNTTPFPKTNAEVLYFGLKSTNIPFTASATETYIDSALYNSYAANDLRKAIFFRVVNGKPLIKRNYSGLIGLFSGLATDELYLTRAECYARGGQLNAALADLNLLLRNRFETGTFTDITDVNTQTALTIILAERRKELVFRGLRWLDLRRLNLEGYNITPTRNINGTIYTLPPKSPLYAFPIPPDEVALSGLVQNAR